MKLSTFRGSGVWHSATFYVVKMREKVWNKQPINLIGSHTLSGAKGLIYSWFFQISDWNTKVKILFYLTTNVVNWVIKTIMLQFQIYDVLSVTIHACLSSELHFSRCKVRFVFGKGCTENLSVWFVMYTNQFVFGQKHIVFLLRLLCVGLAVSSETQFEREESCNMMVHIPPNKLPWVCRELRELLWILEDANNIHVWICLKKSVQWYQKKKTQTRLIHSLWKCWVFADKSF